MTYHSILLGELERRKKKNPSYSMRAFARDLEVPAPKLSEILRGKKGVSVQRGKKIALMMGLSEVETRLFLDLIESRHGRSQRERSAAQKRIQTRWSEYELSLETFEVISGWHYFALLELTELDGKWDRKSIAQALGLPQEVVNQAVERLVRLGLLVEAKKESFRQTKKSLVTSRDIPSRAIREYHNQILGEAQKALDVTPVEKRDFSALTFSFDQSRMSEVKEYLAEMQNQFEERFKSGKTGSDVCVFAYQVFPVTYRNKKEQQVKK